MDAAIVLNSLSFSTNAGHNKRLSKGSDGSDASWTGESMRRYRQNFLPAGSILLFFTDSFEALPRKKKKKKEKRKNIKKECVRGKKRKKS
jgi:hypothetical protein